MTASKEAQAVALIFIRVSVDEDTVVRRFGAAGRRRARTDDAESNHYELYSQCFVSLTRVKLIWEA